MLFKTSSNSNSEVTGPHIGIYRKLIYVYYYENIFFRQFLSRTAFPGAANHVTRTSETKKMRAQRATSFAAGHHGP
jgi:hypothetical protein